MLAGLLDEGSRSTAPTCPWRRQGRTLARTRTSTMPSFGPLRDAEPDAAYCSARRGSLTPLETLPVQRCVVSRTAQCSAPRWPLIRMRCI